MEPAKQKVLSLVDEFRSFALKGNVVDLAVAVIIGSAFGKIVDSLVKHIIMPTVGLLVPSNQGYLGWKFVVASKEIPYGIFLGEVANFIIVAFAVFLFVVKFLGWVFKTKAAEVPLPTEQPATKDQILLGEIRDLLKSNLGNPGEKP